MPHTPAPWYFVISVIHHQGFHRVKFVIIPHTLYSRNICEILLYNWQLVVLLGGRFYTYYENSALAKANFYIFLIFGKCSTMMQYTQYLSRRYQKAQVGRVPVWYRLSKPCDRKTKYNFPAGGCNLVVVGCWQTSKNWSGKYYSHRDQSRFTALIIWGIRCQ